MSQPTCIECKRSINEDRDYRRVEGYIRRRPQGGTNTLALRIDHNEWLCFSCLEGRKRGLAKQTKML